MVEKKYSINVEIKNETENISLNIVDLKQVEYNEEVKFNITPIKGFKVNSVIIVDVDGNEIEYNITDNNYAFTMPAVDVTIIPSYERVSSSIIVNDNKNKKEFVIEVNDAKAVVYEDTVKFTITPEVGYEVDKIEITDKEGNQIKYRKISKDNEYEFVMPDTDVVITPTYRKLESINVPDTVKNPNTATGMYVVISIIVLVFSSSIYFIMKKRKVTL